MIDFSIIKDLKNTNTYHRLGNIPLYGQDMFSNMDDVMDYYYSSRTKSFDFHMSEFSIIKMQDIQHEEKTPQMIKDIFNNLKQFNDPKKGGWRGGCVAALIGLNNNNGFDYHEDPHHVLTMNIIGNTIWHFKNNEKVLMTPGDLLFVPPAIGHSVSATEERFTVAFAVSYCNQN